MNPLKNKKILITRDSQAAASFQQLLEKEQAKPVTVPLIKIDCMKRPNLSIDVKDCEWVFFTSRNGVECFLQNKTFATALHHCRIAAVGEKTAQTLVEHNYTVDFIPSVFNAETMAKEFLTRYETTKPTLFVRGVIASPILLDAFTKANRRFYCVEVYDTIIHPKAKQALQATLAHHTFDYVTFTSPSAVEAFVQSVEDVKQELDVPTVCIGTTTEQKALSYGFTQTIVPEKFTIEAMIEAMKIDCIQKG